MGLDWRLCCVRCVWGSVCVRIPSAAATQSSPRSARHFVSWTVPRSVFGAGVFWRSAPALRVGPNPVGSVSSLGDAHTGKRSREDTARRRVCSGNWDPPDLQDPDLPVPCLGRPPPGLETEMVLAEAEPAGSQATRGDTGLWFSCLGSRVASLATRPSSDQVVSPNPRGSDPAWSHR